MLFAEVLTRRGFFKKLGQAGLLLVGGKIVSGCGGAHRPLASVQPLGGKPVDCLANGTSAFVEDLHTPNHTVTIPLEDIAVGGTKTYLLTDNGSGHVHEITLNPADFAGLQANQVVEIFSVGGNHSHLVRINCA